MLNQDESLSLLLDKVGLLGDKDYYDYTPADIKNEIIKIIIDLKKSYWQATIKGIEKELQLAEKNADENKVKILMSDLKILNDKLRQIQISNYE